MISQWLSVILAGQMTMRHRCANVSIKLSAGGTLEEKKRSKKFEPCECWKIKAIFDLLLHAMRAFARKLVTTVGCFRMTTWLSSPRMCDSYAVNSNSLGNACPDDLVTL